MKNEQLSVGQSVLEFYRVLPFNYRQSVPEHAREIKNRNVVQSYPVLPPLLESPGMRVLEIGCGPGWMSNGIAHHYGCPVTGLDFNPVAVERAQAVATKLGAETDFLVGDLFQWSPKSPFPLVISLGVLHHTDNCHGAVRRLYTDFTAPGGHALIGLYHEPGRRPFLDHFADMKAAGACEDKMLERFRELSNSPKDETHLMSWFRDQVLHPYETQHTLKEMVAVAEDCGMTLESTSINRFQPINSVEDLYAQELDYADLAAERLAAGKYFPGFFVFLARKAS